MTSPPQLAPHEGQPCLLLYSAFVCKLNLLNTLYLDGGVIHAAAGNGKSEMIEYLVQNHGATVNILDKYGISHFEYQLLKLLMV